ncbi:MAG: hypothetical protein NTZ10_02095 [Candidatus Saganbacteria bacterium]|nr:hypothetical protein [Candidatus Saganbacteria bacterium]
MSKLIKKYNDKHTDSKLGLSFTRDNATARFTISNSRSVTKGTMNDLFSCEDYFFSYPKIDEERDHNGNLQGSLVFSNPNKDQRTGKRIINGQVTTKLIESSPDSKTAKEIPVGACFLAEYNKETTALQTRFLETCIAVTFYEPGTKTGVLAHFDSQEKAKELKNVINTLKNKGIDLSKVQVSIIGGDGSDPSNRTFIEISKILDDEMVPITETNIGFHASRPFNINLDLSNGKITSYKETIQYKNDPSYNENFFKKFGDFTERNNLVIIDELPDI